MGDARSARRERRLRRPHEPRARQARGCAARVARPGALSAVVAILSLACGGAPAGGAPGGPAPGGTAQRAQREEVRPHEDSTPAPVAPTPEVARGPWTGPRHAVIARGVELQDPSMLWHDGAYRVIYTEYDARGSAVVELTPQGAAPPARFDRLYARAASSGDELGVFFADSNRQHVMFVRSDAALVRAGSDMAVGRGASGARDVVYAEGAWLALFTEDVERRRPYGLPHRGMRRVRYPSELVLRLVRVPATGGATQTFELAGIGFMDRLSLSRLAASEGRAAVAWCTDETITLHEIGSSDEGVTLQTGPCTNALLATDGRGYGLVYRSLGLGNGPDELVFVYLVDGREQARATIARTPPGVMTITTPALAVRAGRFVVAWSDTSGGTPGYLHWAEVDRSARITSAPQRLTSGTDAEGWPRFSVGGPPAIAYVVRTAPNATEIHVSFLPER